MSALEFGAMAVLLVASWCNNTVMALCVLAIQYALAGYGAWRWFTKS